MLTEIPPKFSVIVLNMGSYSPEFSAYEMVPSTCPIIKSNKLSPFMSKRKGVDFALSLLKN